MKPETNERRRFRKGSPSWFLILTGLTATLCLLLIGSRINAQSSGSFRICTFNIQNFGKTKLNDSARVNKLASIIRKYDIVAIQEISDVSGVLPGAFRDIVNKEGRKSYQVACSDRTGRQANDKSSQEQYAFYYDTTLFSIVSSPMLYNDSAFDYFAREPFTARFTAKTGNSTFVLVTIHTAPAKAVAEIESLDEVVKWASDKYDHETEIIVCGDFNASCSYARPADLDKLSIRGSNYYWVVPDDTKTNLSEKSNCAYDRFVLTLDAKSHYTGIWGVDACYTSKTISDHWPVWAEFKFDRTPPSEER
jgi:endonuclease/exonuclease/phosphatase family metal-dependent hydrolase